MWANLPETILVPRVHLPIMRIITEDAHQIKTNLCFSPTTPCHLRQKPYFLVAHKTAHHSIPLEAPPPFGRLQAPQESSSPGEASWERWGWEGLLRRKGEGRLFLREKPWIGLPTEWTPWFWRHSGQDRTQERSRCWMSPRQEEGRIQGRCPKE